MRTMRWATAALVAAVLVAGCAGPQPGGRATSQGGSINIVLYQKPKLFSPLETAHGPDQLVMSLIFQSLMTQDPNLKLVPQLAEKVDVNADATEFTFQLKKGLKWSDGKPFTAADVLFTHQVLADPKSTSPTSGLYRDVAEMTAPDDSTFVLTMTTPNYGILAQIGVFSILPKHILGNKPVESLAKDPFFTNPTVGLGPFQFVKYEVDQYVELKANPRFAKKPKLDQIFLKPLTADVGTAQLGTGELDLAPVSPTDKDTLAEFDTLDFVTAKDGGFVRIALNLLKPKFQDARVRQALLYAINRKAIIDSALPGFGKPRNSSFDPGVSGDGIEQYAYDPDKAKRLLTEAGWDYNQTITLNWIPVSNPDRDAAATAIESQLKEIGVKVTLAQVDAGWTSDAFTKMEYDMYLFGGGNYALDSWGVNNIQGCATKYPNGGNLMHFCDQELDAKMAEANATTDPDKRGELYADAAKIDNEQVPYLLLYSAGGLWAVNKRLQNFKPMYPTGGPFWHPEEWQLAG